MQTKYDNIAGFVVVHLIAGLAAIPWFFSWTGVVLLLLGIYVFGMLGINLCFHRMLAHRSLVCPLWLERTFVLFGVCSVQDSPAHWVAVHRQHHQFADHDKDPHSPLAGFLWSHMGWLLVKSGDMKRSPLLERYSQDIMRDPFCAWFERRSNWIKVALLSWIVYFAGGFTESMLSGGRTADAVQFGMSLVVWGAALRTVVVWHMTWAVNSVTHTWGYRNYDTPDLSRNNPIIGFLVHGEGWHNNHHADPRSAQHGHQWWELDMTWLTIRLLSRLGLATDISVPSPVLAIKPAKPPLVGPRLTRE